VITDSNGFRLRRDRGTPYSRSPHNARVALEKLGFPSERLTGRSRRDQRLMLSDVGFEILKAFGFHPHPRLLWDVLTFEPSRPGDPFGRPRRLKI